MPQLQQRFLLGALALAALLVFTLRDSIALLLIGGAGLIAVFLIPVLCIVGGVALVRSLRQRSQQSQTAPLAGLTTHATTATTPSLPPLVQRLNTAFRRNQPVQLQQALASLPAWPISQQVNITAQALLELKQSIYRAQTEGAPAPMIQRYLQNTNQATETLWQLASKVDALGKQQVAYELIAPHLQQEAQQVAQLQQTARSAQEGIALLVVSGIQTDALRRADEDLSALTRAMKELVGSKR